MLKGYTVPLSPRGIANLATRPPWHYAGIIIAMEFWTDPGAAAAPLPSLNGFTDALRRHGSIRWLHVRHEEAAAFAATACD